MSIARIDNLGGGVTPKGTLEITSNGTYDVTEYAEAEVSCPQATLIGSYSGNKSIDVSSYKRPTDTVNNFLIEMTSIGSATCAHITGKSYYELWGQFAGTTPAKSLSGNTLSITGMNGTAYTYGYDTHSYIALNSKAATISYKVYHI